MVVLDVGVGAREGHVGQTPRGVRIGDIEQRDLRTGATSLGVGVGADPEQQPRADRVEVRRVAGDLQLAGDARVGRIGQVEHVQRVDLAERDHIARVADEPDPEDPLVDAEPGDHTDLDELAAGEPEGRDSALTGGRPRVEPAGSVVLATRSTPSCSDNENWLRRWPCTRPEPR